MKINLPNQITIGRLLLAIVFFICLEQYDAKAPKAWLMDFSLALFVVAALTDVIDGYLARKHNQVTSFGRLIDPFVDKILVLGAYIFLAGDGFIDSAGRKVTDVAMWMVVVILGRELLVTSLRGVTEAAGTSFGANIHGKAKMFLQSVTVGWILVTVGHPQSLAFAVGLRAPLIYLTVIITVLSGFSYLHAARHLLSETSRPTT
ncbi:MAG TPA: CDP-diacylglycerol--glycerol-3-phosphate 3-phosphatidyltransferase [Phycisphaerae bacterium]|nr:CDP-diacylglycerol--glycerol-3-phosphate 3-phosphatidyltransferase [Phycisphaerae bacterium]HRR87154.1 CDP-diacylglycerol--glycerol-3-phosphate 3-phosphatidyltransferase [Phycisphaerae bacterium]